MVNIGSLAGHVIAAELDVAFSIAGEGVDSFIGLTGFGSKVILYLDLPPVTGSVLGSDDHGVFGIFTDNGSQAALVPDSETGKAVGLAALALAVYKAVGMLGLAGNLFQRNGSELQTEVTQTAQFQTVVGIGCADGEGHGEGIATGNHMVNIRSLAGHVIAAELDITLCIAGEGVDSFVGLTGFGGEVIFHLNLPPVAGFILGDQDHGVFGIFTGQELHGSFGPCLIALKTVALIDGLFDFLHGIVGKDQLEGAQTAQLQTAVRLSAVLKLHGEGVFARNHIVFIAAVVESIVIDELDAAGCIAGEGVGQLIALTCGAAQVLLHLDLPPVSGIVLGSQGHGGGSILSCNRLHRSILPNLEAAETGCGGAGVGGCLGGLVNALNLDFGKQQFAGTQTAQFQTAVAVAAGLQFYGEGVLTLLHVKLIGAVVSCVIIDELDAAGCVAGKAEGHTVILALLALQFLLQLYLPPVGGRIGVGKKQTLSRLSTHSGGQCAFGPDIHTGEGILGKELFQLSCIHFLKINVSKGHARFFTAGKHTQFQASTLGDGFVGSQIEGSHAQITVHPLGSGADDRCRIVIYGIGHVLGLAVFLGEYKGGFIGLALDQTPVNSQLDPPALVGLESGSQSAVSGQIHIAAGIFGSHIQKILGEICLQLRNGGFGKGQFKGFQTAQFQTGSDLACLTGSEAHDDLIFAAYDFIGVGIIENRIGACKTHTTGNIAGELVNCLIIVAVNSIELGIQPDSTGFTGCVGRGQRELCFLILPLHGGQTVSGENCKGIKAVAFAALAQTIGKFMAVGFCFYGGHAFRRFCCYRLLIVAGCQGDQIDKHQKECKPSGFGCFHVSHNVPSKE